MTDLPTTLAYSIIVSWNSVRIAFLIAALNGINISSCDIGNVYLNAALREKVYMTVGPELIGQHVLIVRALYGLKSSGTAWHSHLANTLHHMGFTSCLADPDVWFKTAIKAEKWNITSMYSCM